MALWPNLKSQILGNRSALESAQRAMQLQQAALSNRNSTYYPLSLLRGGVEPEHKPSPHYPNTLGWRAWVWDITADELRSPVHGTAWNGSELRCETWDESEVIRGVAGIHARLVPDAWSTAFMGEAPNGGRAYAEMRGDGFRACIAIQGIVERFGRYVLGSEGWRAEWVQIRKLAAPTDDIGLALERAFPDVEVIYGNR